MLRSYRTRAAAFLGAINGALRTTAIASGSTARFHRDFARFEPLESRRLMSVNVPTYHYSNSETGSNTSETTLTLANVNPSSFGKIASMTVAGQMYGQPLIMTGIQMSNGETHDIVIVTTETDLVYAFDAYGNNPAQGYLWKTSLLQTGETPVPESDYGTTDIIPSLGITGTPVINTATNTLYVVGLFKESNATYQQRLYALNITGGNNAIAPVVISASVSGSTLINSTYNNVGGIVTFSAFRENQRPALTLANGEVYIGWASHGDQNPWHGWLMGYNAGTLHQDYAYCNTVDGEQGGIWMSGGGIAVDANGNLYFTAGNGTFDANTNTTANADYAMALEQVSPSLTPMSYFTPYNQTALSNADLDYGCANVILLTGQGGAYPNEVLSAGKWGQIYLNDMTSLGGYNSNGAGPNSDLGEATLAGANTGTSNVHNTMVYWNGYVYLGGDALTLQAFTVANGVLGATPSSQTSIVFGTPGTEDGQGAGLTVSSNGASNGIMWALDNSHFAASQAPSSAILYAYNASNLSQTPLWSSSTASNNRDAAGIGIKFQDPVVANGHVYVAGAGTLTVYGLLNVSTNTPTVVTTAAANPTTLTTNTTMLSVLGSDPSGDLSPNYTWSATTIPSGAASPTFSINGTNNANVTTAAFTSAGAYTLTATIEDPNSGLSTTSSVNVTVLSTLSSIGLTPATASVSSGATQQFTATGYDQYGSAQAVQPAFTFSVSPGGAGGTINSSGLYTAPAGAGFDTVITTSGSFSASSSVVVGLPAATNQVNLSTVDTRVGIVTDGTTLPSNGGIDGDGDAISANIVGTSVVWNSSNFNIPAPTAGNATLNVLNGTGQTITLPQNKYAAIKILALHVNGNGTNTGDAMTLTYVGGTTKTISQRYSDWFTPGGFTGESKAVTMSYRDQPTGGQGTGPFFIYGYSFALTNTKTVQSLKLPADSNFIIVAIDLVGLTVTTPAAASPATVTGTTTSLSALGTSPTGDAAPTYTWYTTASPVGAAAPTFSVNGTTASNASTATFHQAGAYTFTVAITDPTTGLSGITSVNVTVVQTVTSVVVTPNSPAPIHNGQTQQFGATAVDQFNQSFTTPPAFTWTVLTGPGSISSTGLYQASSTGSGTATVRATVGTVNGQATIQVTLPAWLGGGSVATWNSSSGILSVTGATSIIADPGTDQPILVANGPSAVVTINPVGALQIHLGGMSLTAGADVIVPSLGAGRTASNHRALILGLPGATSAPPLTIDASSQLNLTDNDLVDHDGNFAAVNGLLKSGLNAGVGYWNGPGIASSSAAGASLTALDEGQPASAGTFDGETVSTADIEVRYSYYGDATVDGHVDGSDYTRIDNGYLNQSTGFNSGDFNYDGVVNGSDYTLIDNAYNMQGAALSAAVATATAEVASSAFATRTGTIPEVMAKETFATTPLVDLLGNLDLRFHSSKSTAIANPIAEPSLASDPALHRLKHASRLKSASPNFSDVQIILA